MHLFGHENVTTTNKYLYSEKLKQQSAVKVLDRTFRKEKISKELARENKKGLGKTRRGARAKGMIVEWNSRSKFPLG